MAGATGGAGGTQPQAASGRARLEGTQGSTLQAAGRAARRAGLTVAVPGKQVWLCIELEAASGMGSESNQGCANLQSRTDGGGQTWRRRTVAVAAGCCPPSSPHGSAVALALVRHQRHSGGRPRGARCSRSDRRRREARNGGAWGCSVHDQLKPGQWRCGPLPTGTTATNSKLKAKANAQSTPRGAPPTWCSTHGHSVTVGELAIYLGMFTRAGLPITRAPGLRSDRPGTRTTCAAAKSAASRPPNASNISPVAPQAAGTP